MVGPNRLDRADMAAAPLPGRQVHSYDPSSDDGALAKLGATIGANKHGAKQNNKTAVASFGDCVVCLTTVDQPVVLRCGHAFCKSCLRRCASHDIATCPTCRAPHELDPDALQKRLVGFRSSYGNWRKGGARGARNEITAITTGGGEMDCCGFDVSASVAARRRAGHPGRPDDDVIKPLKVGLTATSATWPPHSGAYIAAWRALLGLLAILMAIAVVLGARQMSACDDTDGDGVWYTLPGVQIETIHEGDGETRPMLGDTVRVHYTGRLALLSERDGAGRQVASSRGLMRPPFEFTVGAGRVIRGLDEAVKRMSLGEHVNLTLTPAYGYGRAGDPPLVPPDAPLQFDLELVAVEHAGVALHDAWN